MNRTKLTDVSSLRSTQQYVQEQHSAHVCELTRIHTAICTVEEQHSTHGCELTRILAAVSDPQGWTRVHNAGKNSVRTEDFPLWLHLRERWDRKVSPLTLYNVLYLRLHLWLCWPSHRGGGGWGELQGQLTSYQDLLCVQYGPWISSSEFLGFLVHGIGALNAGITSWQDRRWHRSSWQRGNCYDV